MRIPKPLADEVGLKDNSPVQLSLHDQQLVIVPVRQPASEALLAQVTDSNRHAEALTGPAIGGEACSGAIYVTNAGMSSGPPSLRKRAMTAGRRPAVALSPLTYNAKVGLALLCPITSAIKGYPFEVSLPHGLPVSGVILADQVKSLDWQAREVEFICALPAAITWEILEKDWSAVGGVDPWLGPGNVQRAPLTAAPVRTFILNQRLFACKR